MNQPLMRPPSASVSTTPPATSRLMGQPGAQAQDEGKMSISIDFGTHICC
jgi:hypothetical protein